MSIYAFEKGPSYAPLTPQAAWTSAYEQPLSVGRNLWEQGKAGILESFGLGTAIRDTLIPQGNTERSLLDTANALIPGPGQIKEAIRATTQAFINEDQPSLSEEAYRSSAWYRENIPYDPGMTEQRAEALASWDDARRVREYFAQKRPISSFVGNFGGQAFDPINYIPVFGQLVRAAAISKAGRIAGSALVGAGDAAANTAVAGLVTREARGSYGDDVSWQATVSEIAMAALIGGAFGSLSGAIGARYDARTQAEATDRLSTLKATQEARIALNEAIDGLVEGGDIRLSPNATEPMARMADELVVFHGSAADFDTFDIGKVGTGEGGSLQGRGIYFNNTRAVGEFYREQLGGKRGVLYEATIAAQKDEFLDWRRPLSEQSQAVQERVGKILDLGPVEPAFVYSDANGGKLYYRLGLGFMNYGKVVKEGGAYTVTAKKERIGSFSSLDEAEAALRKNMKEQGVEWTGAQRTGQDVFETLGGRGKAEAVLREAGIPGVVDDAKYASGPSRDFVVFNDAILRVRKKNDVAIDTSPARPEPIPEGRKQAEASVAKPDDYKSMAAQYRVDPETGSFVEEAELKQLEAEGRLTEADRAAMEEATAIRENAAAYGEALRAAVACII